MSKTRKPRCSNREALGMNAVEQFFLQIGWIKRPQHECDMGIDLHVEECCEGNPTGRLLALQVKSGESYWNKTSNDSVVFTFDQTHYDYWIDHSLPVLVVLYHPDTKKMIWQHISLGTCLNTGKRWNTHIPLSQVLSPDCADQLSRLAKRPSPQDVVRQEQERIERLDPRFTAKVIASDNNIHTTFHAKEDVPLRFTISGKPEEIQSKSIDLFDRGKVVAFEREQIAFTGSPVFGQFPKEFSDQIKVQIAKSRDVNIVLTALDDQGVEKTRIDSIPATMTAGTKAFTVLGRLQNSPLSIIMENEIGSSDKEGTDTLGFDAEYWIGKPLMQLSYFDRIHRLFESFQNGAKLRIEIFLEGNKLFSSIADGLNMRLEKRIWFVDLVSKARLIAKRLGLTPSLPDLSMKQVDEVELLYKLLQEGEVSINVPHLRYLCKLIPNAGLIDSLKTISADEPAPLALNCEETQCMPFLGEDVEVGPMLMALTSVLLTNRDTVEQELRNSDGDKEVELIFEGTDECKLTRKIKLDG